VRIACDDEPLLEEIAEWWQVQENLLARNAALTIVTLQSSAIPWGAEEARSHWGNFPERSVVRRAESYWSEILRHMQIVALWRIGPM
jgi:hypothetical protein